MGKKQLAIRVPDTPLPRLNNYPKEKKTYFREIVIGHEPLDLDRAESIPLPERVTAACSNLAAIETQLKEIETKS